MKPLTFKTIKTGLGSRKKGCFSRIGYASQICYSTLATEPRQEKPCAELQSCEKATTELYFQKNAYWDCLKLFPEKNDQPIGQKRSPAPPIPSR
ncbi:hypothetical protein PoB_004460100 [Plakobranchus ocellatus]|uniref:Uncharacterized protein n=1 Tax=Plakobranchus ocellatus TaxID=259542 RepID=A0AAV4BCE6_9GAST|nr:hypothetical protein PoB_004460100 [Plakobranchus ocellatus]